MRKVLAATFLVFLSVTFCGVSQAKYGVNIDPANAGGYPQPASLGCIEWVRIEYKDCTPNNPPTDSIDMFREVLTNYKSAGKKTLLIVDYLSYPFTDYPNIQASTIQAFAERVGYIESQLGGLIDAYEIWNEPDHPRHVPISPSTFSQIVTAVSSRVPASKIVIGGFASGDPNYLAQANIPPSQYMAVGVHPYGKKVDGYWPDWTEGDMITLVNQYKAISGKPVWITEIGFDSTNESYEATYLQKVYTNNVGADQIFWFAWSDAMVRPFGLTTTNQRPKEAYGTYMGICGGNPNASISMYPPIDPPGEGGCAVGGSVAGPRYIVGKITSARITLDERGREKSNQPVQGATVCGYHAAGAHIGTGITGFYGSAVTDENGVFKLEGVYSPGDHYSNGPINDADIIVVYTGIDYQEAEIIPMAYTMEDFGIEKYNRILYGDLDLVHTLLPVEDIQTESGVHVTPGNFDGIPGYRPATYIPEGATDPVTDTKCPEHAFYTSRLEQNTTICEQATLSAGAVPKVDYLYHGQDVAFAPDDQYKDKASNEGADYTQLDEIKDYTIPIEGKSSQDVLPEGRASTKATFNSLEDNRAVICKMTGCKKVTTQPKDEGDQVSAEIFSCEELKRQLSGLKARAIASHLASPSYYNEADEPTYTGTEEQDINALSHIYRTNLDALGRTYCISEDYGAVEFGQVEPYDGWKSPEEREYEIGDEYLLDNSYFNPMFPLLMQPGADYNQTIKVSNDSYDVSGDKPGPPRMDMMAGIRSGPMVEGAPEELRWNPESCEEGGDGILPRCIDNATGGYKTEHQTVQARNTFSNITSDVVSSRQYQEKGAIPFTDLIAPPIGDVETPINDRAAIQGGYNIPPGGVFWEAVNSAPATLSQMENFKYSQQRYRLGVQNKMCNFSILDGDKLYSEKGRYVLKQAENPTGYNPKGGWYESYFDYATEDAKYGVQGSAVILYGWNTSMSLWDQLLLAFSGFITRIWSFFEVNGTNNPETTTYTEANNCISVIGEIDETSTLDCKFLTTDHMENCTMSEETEPCEVGCDPSDPECICEDIGSIGAGDLWCHKTGTCPIMVYGGKDYDNYKCVAPGVTLTVDKDIEVGIRSRNSKIGFSYMTYLLYPPETKNNKRTAVSAMHGADSYVTQATEQFSGEGSFGIVGQAATVSQLGDVVRDPIF